MSGVGGTDGRVESEANREADDAQTMAELRARLDGWKLDQGPRALTRPNAISLLKLLSECLGPALDETLGALETGERIVADHPSVNLLNELIDALADLDSGKTHDALGAARHGANRRLATWQSRLDKVWLDTVLILQRREEQERPKDGPKVLRKAAEEKLARALRAVGKNRLGKPVTQKLLKSLRDRQAHRK